MSRALFIGRFQPFHLGHLSAIKQILAESESDDVIIAIGSAEDNFLPENPFTASERFQMIKAALDAEKIDPGRYCIIPIRNINNYALWVRHVEVLIPPFKIVYTSSPIVKKLFLNYAETKKYTVREVKKEININATEIRKLMLEEGNWQQYLHPSTVDYIEKIKGVERVKVGFSLTPNA